MLRPARIFLFSLLFVLLSLFTTYMLQDLFIFQPTKLDQDYQFAFDQPFEEHFIVVPSAQESNGKEERINTLWFKSKGPSKGLILYFHGNRGNLTRWGTYAQDLTIHGYDVLMIDYRGYGKSSGRPTEAGFYVDAELVLGWAQSKIQYTKLIIYGRSLGAAVASMLATKIQPDLLILETPFDEILGVIWDPLQPLARLLPARNVFSNKDHLANVHCRKLIFHGTADRIVPLNSALGLKPFLGPLDEFIIIPEGGHRNLRTFPEYQLKLAEALDAI